MQGRKLSTGASRLRTAALGTSVRPHPPEQRLRGHETTTDKPTLDHMACELLVSSGALLCAPHPFIQIIIGLFHLIFMAKGEGIRDTDCEISDYGAWPYAYYISVVDVSSRPAQITYSHSTVLFLVTTSDLKPWCPLGLFSLIPCTSNLLPPLLCGVFIPFPPTLPAHTGPSLPGCVSVDFPQSRASCQDLVQEAGMREKEI